MNKYYHSRVKKSLPDTDVNWFLFESGEIVFTRIYDVRTRLKVKQDELAKLSGVSQSQISKYEKGEVTNPR